LAILFVKSRFPDDNLAETRPAPTPFAIAPPAPADPAAPTTLPTSAAGAIHLQDVSDSVGINFRHHDGSSGRRYIVESMSTGLATLDYDGDGWIDLYFPNGAPLPGCVVEVLPRHALYRNLGDWTFADVSVAAGLGAAAYGMGVTVGDYDNDGHADIYVSNFGPNILYRNNGDGTFTDVTRQAGVASGPENRIGAGVCFLDIDGDGDLDLFVSNYLILDFAAHVTHYDRGHPSYPSPREYRPLPDTLYRNNGDGTFTDISSDSGISAHPGRGMGVIGADFDGDGDTDIFVCNDVQENFLFRNDGTGRFEECAVLAGVATNRQGEMIANMGIDCGDFDHDGRLDFFTTNYQGQLPMLFRNCGDGIFEDVAFTSGASAGSLPFVNWGCGWVDFDHDGWRDLFIANGHTEDNIERRDLSTAYHCPNLLLRNLGAGRFADVSAVAGDGLWPVQASRGAAFDDLDNDGDVDGVIVNSRTGPTILRNTLVESGCRNHWLQVRLRGTTANRDGVGAQVTVTAGDLVQLAEVHGGRGYQSHWGSRLHFGLGTRPRVDRVEIRWIGGGREVFRDLPADRLITLIEGMAQRAANAADAANK
jgi:hypothetical protein